MVQEWDYEECGKESGNSEGFWKSSRKVLEHPFVLFCQFAG